MCPHQPPCPRLTARTATPPTPSPFTPSRVEPACNGVIVFDDLGDPARWPGGSPHRPTHVRTAYRGLAA
jgi:hypothetical protein